MKFHKIVYVQTIKNIKAIYWSSDTLCPLSLFVYGAWGYVTFVAISLKNDKESMGHLAHMIRKLQVTPLREYEQT